MAPSTSTNAVQAPAADAAALYRFSAKVAQRMKLSNFSIRTQLLGLVGVLLLVLLAWGGVTLYQLEQANNRLERMYVEHLEPMDSLKTVSDLYGILVVDTVHKVGQNHLSWEQARQNIKHARTLIEQSWQHYASHRTSWDDNHANDIAHIEVLMADANAQVELLVHILVAEDRPALHYFATQQLYAGVDPLVQHLQRLSQQQKQQARRYHEASNATYHHVRHTFAWWLLGSAVLGGLLGMWLLRGVRRPVLQAQGIAQRITQGDLSQPIYAEGNSETAHLLRALNTMQQQLQQQAHGQWVKTHLSDITTTLQQVENYTELGRALLSALAPLVNAGCAAFYVLNPEQQLQLLASYGHPQRKMLGNRFDVGQGLVGQCALEKAPITVHQPPPDYIQIQSGLGEAVPACIMLLPVMHQDQVLGVLELASFVRPSEREESLLDTLMPMLAMHMEILQRKVHTQRLLEETQQQAQRMEKQAAQLEEQAVEMEAQQAELMDTEAWYRSIVESAPDGMVVVNEGGTIVLCNPKLATTFGYTQEELLGQNVDMLVPDDIRPRHPQNRANFMASRGYHAVETGLELRGRHKNGTVFPAEFGMSLLPSRGARGRCVAVSVRDITIRQKAQALVEQNAQQMRFILESSPVAVRISQVAGTRQLVFANQAMAQLLHTTHEQVMQMHPSACYADLADFQRIIERTDRGQSVFNTPMALKAVDGTAVQVQASYIPMDYNGQPCILTWFFDLGA